MIAAYHINHDKWGNDRALKDAMAHHMSFFQFPRQNFIKNFQPHSVNASLVPAVAAPAAATPAPTAAGVAAAAAAALTKN